MFAELLAPRIFRLSYGLALAAAAVTFCSRLVLFIEMFVFSNENDVTISHSAPKVNLLEILFIKTTYELPTWYLRKKSNKVVLLTCHFSLSLICRTKVFN
jgi:hypothetical protein